MSEPRPPDPVQAAPAPPVAGEQGWSEEAALDEAIADASLRTPTPLLGRVAKSAALLSASTILGQAFVLGRELFVASRVGTSPELDALLVAAVVPAMGASLLASGTAAAIVPGYVEAEQVDGTAAARRLLSAVITWTALLGVGVIGLVLLVGPVLVLIAGPGLSPDGKAAAEAYLPYVAPMLLFQSVGALLAAMFQIHSRLRPIAVAWAIGPLASLAVTVFLWGPLGLTAYALAMTLQQAAVVVVLALAAARLRILPRPTLRAPRQELLSFSRHAAPLTISASVLQLNLLSDRAVASLITPGAVSALRYAEGIIKLPLNSIGPAWSTALYPALVRAGNKDEDRSLGQAAGDAASYLMAIFIPLAVATAALAPLVIRLIYARGAFDAEAVSLTSHALAGFAGLLFLTMVNSVLTGAHNVRRRGVFLMAMGFVDATLNAALNVGLGIWIGVAGVALSTTITIGIVQLVKAWRLGALDHDFDLRALAGIGWRSVLASSLVGLPVALVAWSAPADLPFLAALAVLGALLAIGLAGYVAIGLLLGMREPWVALRVIAALPSRALAQARSR